MAVIEEKVEYAVDDVWRSIKRLEEIVSDHPDFFGSHGPALWDAQMTLTRVIHRLRDKKVAA